MDMSVHGHAWTACLSILPSNVANAQTCFFFSYMALLLWYAAGVLYVVTEY